MKLYTMYFPAYTRAFAASREVQTTLSPDYVHRSEFRLLVSYLCVYALAFDAFTFIDSSSEYSSGALGNESNGREQRLSRTEWLAGCGKVCNHGFIGLANTLDPSATEQSLGEIFNRMDVNDRGTVLFTEWYNYLTAAEVLSGTLMGSLVAVDALNGNDGDDLKSDDGTAGEEQVGVVAGSRSLSVGDSEVTVEPAVKELEAANQVSRRGVLLLLLLLLIAALVLVRLTGNDVVDSTREEKASFLQEVGRSGKKYPKKESRTKNQQKRSEMAGKIETALTGIANIITKSLPQGFARP
jgi:hypothetical protein